MVDIPTVRGLCLALPDAVDASSAVSLMFSVAGRGFAWTYLERARPRGPRRPRLDVLAVRCDLARKEMLIAAAPERFFDDGHYRGYPAILVRLEAIAADELRALLEGAVALTRVMAATRRRGKETA